ncbi:MAG: aldo/keto reductase [Candidatus Lokiarchaeota archaeon]|nr:aldo/keto reductase [Candidatus Lokiarchaeota archaeon]
MRRLPKIGFGTWMLSGADCTAAVLAAIDAGYRFIDTAQYYDNEAQVGEAIAATTVPREEFVIATKVWYDVLAHDDVLKSTATSLKKLGLKYVDILYVHWPTKPHYNPKETLKAFSELVDRGKVRHIGVSNFTPALVDEAIGVCEALGKGIIADQVEHHPLLQQRRLREHLQERGLALVAYSPLGRRRALEVPEIVQVAKKHGASSGQVSLAWIMDHGAIPIPKAKDPAHIKENFDALDLKLDRDDIALIDSIRVERRLINPPSIAPDW